MQSKSEVTKVPKARLDAVNQTFGTFDTSLPWRNSRISKLADILANDDARAQFRCAVEERAAILEYDAGFNRSEAERKARDEIEATWDDRYAN